MSAEDVEKLKAWLQTWDLDALAAGDLDYSPLVDPNVTYEDAVLPDHAGEVYRGYDGLTRSARVWLGPFAERSIELERVFSTGENVVSVHRVRGTFRHTGMEFEVQLAWLYTFREGKITRWRAYLSADEAVEAATRGD